MICSDNNSLTTGMAVTLYGFRCILNTWQTYPGAFIHHPIDQTASGPGEAFVFTSYWQVNHLQSSLKTAGWFVPPGKQDQPSNQLRKYSWHSYSLHTVRKWMNDRRKINAHARVILHLTVTRASWRARKTQLVQVHNLWHWCLCLSDTFEWNDKTHLGLIWVTFARYGSVPALACVIWPRCGPNVMNRLWHWLLQVFWGPGVAQRL